jgi:hypothetical protein
MLGTELAQSFLIVNDSQVGMSKLIRINISHLSPGIYYIKIGEKVEKFLKM